jgi:hypothetical protein
VTGIRRAPGALWRVSAGRVVVLSPTLTQPLLLEGTAALLWVALARPATAADVLDDLLATVDAPRAELASGIDRSVGELAARGAVLTESA